MPKKMQAEEYKKFLDGLEELDDRDKEILTTVFADDGESEVEIPEAIVEYLDSITPENESADPKTDDSTGADEEPAEKAGGEGEEGLTQEQLNKTIRERAERLIAKEAGMTLEEAKSLHAEREEEKRQQMTREQQLESDLKAERERSKLRADRLKQNEIDRALDSAFRKAGIKEDKLSLAHRLSDLSGIEYDEETGKVLKADAVAKAVKKDLPEIFGNGSPKEFPDNDGRPASERELTEQQRQEALEMAEANARSYF
jgi:hypothetical protein